MDKKIALLYCFKYFRSSTKNYVSVIKKSWSVIQPSAYYNTNNKTHCPNSLFLKVNLARIPGISSSSRELWYGE